MTLAQAFRILSSSSAERPLFSIALACGFTPLHLRTFLAANLAAALPGKRVEVQTGLFGDLAGTLESVWQQDTAAIVVALEWPDLDPRLGFRNLGGWGPPVEGDILAAVGSALDRLAGVFKRFPETIPLIVSPPTLPLAPAFHSIPGQAGSKELEVWAALAAFLAKLAGRPSITVVSQSRLLAASPVSSRYDLRADLLSGFPYTIPHAAALGELLARLVQPQPVRKGVITDLDNTLWSGVAGEAGPDAVSWDLAGGSQIHGLYQQLLQALADQGVLIAAASKSEPTAVERVFARTGLAVRSRSVFPVEAHWGPKSESVGRILEAWNVGPADVVFVDDDPRELAEVKRAWPQIECLQFPAGYRGVEALLGKLRDLFGKAHITREDGLRLASLQGSMEARSQTAATEESFLEEAHARIEVQLNPPPAGRRILELVNKTNQFNLNGVRYTAAEWNAALSEPGAFVMAISYADRFGPLGTIAVIQGTFAGACLEIRTWVMSCRAFSRRIEHGCLQLLFDLFEAAEVRLNCAPTARNQPLREMLRLYLGATPEGPVTLSRPAFQRSVPKLYQEVVIDHSPLRVRDAAPPAAPCANSAA